MTSVIGFLFFTPLAFAHEAYVLTQQQFQAGLKVNSTHPFAALTDPSHLPIFITITFWVVLTYLLIILWSATPWAAKADTVIKKANLIGPLIIRLAISASFFYGAQINCILGPELPLTNIPGGEIIRFFEFVIAFMVLLGTFTEIAGLIGLLIFLYVTRFFGLYMLTYLNYLGELLVLFLFGSRFASCDRYFFGKKLWFQKLEKLKKFETPIIRILYGLALIYAGYTIKFQHQILSIEVYNQDHLKNFFHATADFIAAGAGLSEITIGLFIVLGFAMRLTILISLVFITLSILYFREMLWPHFMLYGISFSLLINSADMYTIDRYLPRLTRFVLKKIIGR